MFTSIQYLSLDKFKRNRPALDTVVVSILDKQESPQRPPLGGWRSVIALEFEDTYEELKYSPDIWPDEPTELEHALFSQGAGERVPTATDAKRIVDFLQLHGRSTEKLNLIVHCYGGVSRSAAVAQWASTRFFVPLEHEPGYPNQRLLRLMDKAFTASHQ